MPHSLLTWYKLILKMWYYCKFEPDNQQSNQRFRGDECKVFLPKGGLISERFHFGSNLPQKVPNHHSEHLLFRWRVIRYYFFFLIWAKVKNSLRLSRIYQMKDSESTSAANSFRLKKSPEKNPAKNLDFENSWKWRIIFMHATVWQILTKKDIQWPETEIMWLY